MNNLMPEQWLLQMPLLDCSPFASTVFNVMALEVLYQHIDMNYTLLVVHLTIRPKQCQLFPECYTLNCEVIFEQDYSF